MDSRDDGKSSYKKGSGAEESSGDQPTKSRAGSEVICYVCQRKGHYARKCPLRSRAVPRESTGQKGSTPRMSGLKPDTSKSPVERRLATMATLGVTQPTGGLTIGPRLQTEVEVDGRSVTAMIDTGSPVSIISLEFLLQAWRERDATMPLETWKEQVRIALRKPSITLRAYDST